MDKTVSDTLRSGDWVEFEADFNGVKNGIKRGVCIGKEEIEVPVSFFCRTNTNYAGDNNFSVLVPTKTYPCIYKIAAEKLQCKVYNPSLAFSPLEHSNNFREEEFPSAVIFDLFRNRKQKNSDLLEEEGEIQ